MDDLQGKNAYSSGKLVVSLSTSYEHLVFWSFTVVLSFFVVHLRILIIRVCYYDIKPSAYSYVRM